MKVSVSTISVPPFGRSPTFVFSAAGFIATSTFGASPGVRMSWSAKWSWKPETPGSEPAGARISAGKSGQRREVVAEHRRLAREPVAGELHAVAGVAREADDHLVELLDGFRHALVVAHASDTRNER